MHLALRILPRPASVPMLSVDSAIAEAIEVKTELIHTFSSSALFRRIVERSRDCPGIWINPLAEFTRQEVESCAWLQPELRGKTISETSAETKFNAAALKNCPRIAACAGTWIRLPQGLALSRFRIHPNEIGGATEWLSDWVLPDGVAHRFTCAGLTGWTVKPLRDLRGDRNVEGFSQLFTETLLPAACLDRTTPPKSPGPGWRQLGCLTYEAGALAAVRSDFARSAEDWSNHHVPIWLVTRNVRVCCEANQIKGWAYRPVLEVGSELQKVYAQTWHELFSLTDDIPSIRF